MASGDCLAGEVAEDAAVGLISRRGTSSLADPAAAVPSTAGERHLR